MNRKIKLTTRQILLYLVDGLVTISEPFDRHSFYKKSIGEFYSWREVDKKKFSNDIKRLEREGLIRIYKNQENNTIELSGKGRQKVKLFIGEDYKFKFPDTWDGKWRLVIFDIPEKKKRNRDILRHKLIEIGFIRLQDSVFVFPYDCKEIVDYFIELLSLKKYTQYIVAETIESEIDLTDAFLKANVLTSKSLKK